jgi:nucleotide-binding universal stress UspA family protein
MSTLSISKILVPVDFSARSHEAVRYAGSLARHFHAVVTLLHVTEPPHADYAMVELPDYVAQLTEARRSRANEELQQMLAAVEGFVATLVVTEGSPAEEILKHAEAADMVVMPTQGHSRIREFLIGSVTAKVLHDCHQPVLTGIHLTDDAGAAEWKVGNVLCAVDFGPESVNVLRWGAFLAKEFGAKVSVVHANADKTSGHRLQQSISEAGLDATSIVDAGTPHDVVVATALRTSADVVIIGRGSNATALGRLRAQAYEIVRQSPCPVLSV